MNIVFRGVAIVVGGALALGGLALALWVVGRLTHAFDFHHINSDSNAPTFRMGDLFLASPLLAPHRLNFVTYNPSLPDIERAIFIFRLCGLPGDTVELRRGRLLVNRHDLDAGLHLAHHYTLARADYARLPRTLFTDTTGIYAIGDSVHQVGLADADAARPVLRAVRQVQPAGYLNPAIVKVFPAGCNEDNFGPVVVPPGKCFVLGDNRQNALDSRYTGFVSLRDVVGTVLGEH